MTMTEVEEIFFTLFSHGTSSALITTKMGWANFGRFFTNSSGHPDPSV
jgi:hypothetical protein